MKIFYLTRDFYGTPQIILVAAPDKQTADRLFEEQLKSENNPYDEEAKELDITVQSLTIISLPPGDINYR